MIRKPTAKELRLGNFHPDGTVLSGVEVMAKVKTESSNKVILSFSCGKDSIAAWLALRDAGFEVYPFYMQYIPGLDFVEKSLRYYEDFFQTHIVRAINPSFYGWLYSYVFVDPNQALWVDQYKEEALYFGRMDYGQVADMISEFVGRELELPKETFTATGVRAVDSPNRHSAVKKWGAINWTRRTFMPIWDMKKDQLINLLVKHNCKLPVDYKWFGRSFDGLDYRFMQPLKENAPDDYARICQWFPYVEAEIMRYGLGE